MQDQERLKEEPEGQEQLEEQSGSERSEIAAFRERGWITLDDILNLSADSPADVEEAAAIAREAGMDVVDADGDPWESLEALAEEGPGAFVVEREAPVPAEELGGESPAALYLREISRTPLLSAEEEVELAKQIEAGRAAKRRLERGEVAPEEREKLEEAVRQADAARKRLIESNLRLVVSVAKRYLGRGLSFLDLVQEGNIGLQRAVDKYDWRRGFRFSTYAYWWIRQAIGRAVAEQGRTIRLPIHVIEQLTRLYNVSRELEHQLGRAPTFEEIGERLGVDPERVREAFRAAKVPISLETPVGFEEEATVADFVADVAARAPIEEAEETYLAHSLDEALREILSPREVMVLRLRFGLDRGGEERTLGEVGQELGISRERVRQLEAEIMHKLRRARKFRERFREYLE
jgi:RNA polymerase primary sigma factor